MTIMSVGDTLVTITSVWGGTLVTIKSVGGTLVTITSVWGHSGDHHECGGHSGDHHECVGGTLVTITGVCGGGHSGDHHTLVQLPIIIVMTSQKCHGYICDHANKT